MGHINTSENSLKPPTPIDYSYHPARTPTAESAEAIRKTLSENDPAFNAILAYASTDRDTASAFISSLNKAIIDRIVTQPDVTERCVTAAFLSLLPEISADKFEKVMKRGDYIQADRIYNHTLLYVHHLGKKFRIDLSTPQKIRSFLSFLSLKDAVSPDHKKYIEGEFKRYSMQIEWLDEQIKSNIESQIRNPGEQPYLTLVTGLHLWKFPPQLLSLNLSSVYASINCFSELPEEVTLMPNLTDLGISYNAFRVIPPALTRLTKLTELSISIAEVTDGLNYVPYFKTIPKLTLSGAFMEDPQAVTLLDAIGTAEVVIKLEDRLRFIEEPETNEAFATTAFAGLSPSDIAKIQALEARVKDLEAKLPHNRKRLPAPQIVSASPRVRMNRLLQINKYVTELSLAHIGITELPKEISQLTNLTILDLENTGIKSIPPEIGKLSKLQLLAVSNTGVRTLPRTIGDLPKLRYLNYKNCGLDLSDPDTAFLEDKFSKRYKFLMD